MTYVFLAADWGVDDDGLAYAEFEGERETAPITRGENEWPPIALDRANLEAHRALEQRLGLQIEYHRYDRSHPFFG